MKNGFLACGLLVVSFLADALIAQDSANFIPALGWDRAQQGSFPTSITADAQNAIWVGTEGRGVWRYDPRTKSWTQYTTKDGLGDDIVYALAVDKLNRVWAGHLNHGVSVWNGEKWKNYGILDGPLGDRVFAIATCPTDGAVWIATDCGLARYSVAKDEWDYFTRASGLPSNQIQCIAFNSKGTLFAATQCNGIAVANAGDGYQKWRTADGPARMPAAASGGGLSTNLINQISTFTSPQGIHDKKGETVTAWTTLGKCETDDNGGKWRFTRGLDWQANVRGLYDAPASLTDASEAVTEQLLAQDWVTCAETNQETHDVWIGYRQNGVEVRNLQGKVVLHGDARNLDTLLVRAICVPPKSPPLVAIYDDRDGGLKTLDTFSATLEPGAEAPGSAPPLPSPAKAPDESVVTPLTNRLNSYQKALEPGDGVYLGDDWRTEGDWIGRYGNAYAVLCGLEHIPGEIYASQPGYEVKAGLGPHVANSSGPLLHVSNNVLDDPHVLYNPTLGYRSEAGINDGGFKLGSYPYFWEGPDLWLDVKVPSGCHCVSLYFRNDDSQKVARNKFRDYDIQLLPWSENPDAIQKAAPLASARVCDFWGGVYKQFVVAGPSRFVFRVGRNHSFGTKLQGLFIDQLSGQSDDKGKPLPGFENTTYGPPSLENFVPPENKPVLSAAFELWSVLDNTFGKRGTIGLQIPLRIWAYRAAVSEGAPWELLANWRWQVGIWTPEDRTAFIEAMATAFKAYSAVGNPSISPPASTDQ